MQFGEIVMCVCTFFGHRDCPNTIKPLIREVIIDLIENQNVDTFYIGQQGSFDFLARSVLAELADAYPHIRYSIVLARLPQQNKTYDPLDASNSLLPEGIENVPPRFAINWRNEWMLKQASFVVTYVTHSWGGAAKFTEKATRLKKTVINLADMQATYLD